MMWLNKTASAAARILQDGTGTGFWVVGRVAVSALTIGGVDAGSGLVVNHERSLAGSAVRVAASIRDVLFQGEMTGMKAAAF